MLYNSDDVIDMLARHRDVWARELRGWVIIAFAAGAVAGVIAGYFGKLLELLG